MRVLILAFLALATAAHAAPIQGAAGLDGAADVGGPDVGACTSQPVGDVELWVCIPGGRGAVACVYVVEDNGYRYVCVISIEEIVKDLGACLIDDIDRLELGDPHELMAWLATSHCLDLS